MHVMATLYPSPHPHPRPKNRKLSLVMVVKVNNLAPTKNGTLVQSVASRTERNISSCSEEISAWCVVVMRSGV